MVEGRLRTRRDEEKRECGEEVAKRFAEMEEEVEEVEFLEEEEGDELSSSSSLSSLSESSENSESEIDLVIETGL